MSNGTQNGFRELRRRSGLNMQELAQLSGYSPRTLYRWEGGETNPRTAVIKILEEAVSQKNTGSSSVKFSYIDLFAGIGGLRRGFDAIGGHCVFTSEWDKFAQTTYKANYPCDHEVAGDITKIEANEIPPHDVLLAGFPCQPFSIAGVSKKNSLGRSHGFHCDTQGTLFFDVARIIEHHQPKAFLLENVKNLMSHDKGRTFAVIERTLREELGYQLHTRIIDAKSYVPQHRERIFMVGFRNKNDFNFDDLIVPDAASGPKLKSILHPQNGSEEAEDPYTHGARGKIADKYVLTDKLWAYLQNYAAKHRAKGNGFGFGLCTPSDTARTLSARYYKDGSEILISRGRGKNPRRLTPRECARLMGFDAPDQNNFTIPVSDTQAYKQFGNAVVVPVVNAIAQHAAPFIIDAVKGANSSKKIALASAK